MNIKTLLKCRRKERGNNEKYSSKYEVKEQRDNLKMISDIPNGENQTE